MLDYVRVIIFCIIIIIIIINIIIIVNRFSTRIVYGLSFVVSLSLSAELLAVYCSIVCESSVS